MPNGADEFGEVLQTPDPGLKLLGRYRMTGPPPLVSLLRKIRPVAIIDDLRSGVPGQFQPDPTVAEFERPCAGFVSRTPAGGNVARIELINPPASGVFVITEDLVARTDAAQTVNIMDVNVVQAGGITNTAGIEFRDSRLAGSPIAGFRAEDVAFALSANWQILLGSPLNRPIPLTYTLSPGFSLRFQGGSTNVALQIGLRWRERSIT